MTDLLARRMTGRCCTGSEADGGTLHHAVSAGGWVKALCGAQPGRRGNGWSEDTQVVEAVTCARCLRKLKQLAPPPTPPPPPPPLRACGHAVHAPHPCPFAEEVHGDDTPCTCCDACTWQCARDI